MPTWILLMAGAAAIIAVLIILPIRDAAKARRRIRGAFGKPPKKTYGLDHAFKFYRSYAARYPSDDAVDALTWNDLDLDTVYGRLNACQSAAGDARLYTVLRRPHTVAAEAEAAQAARRQLMDLFAKDSALREQVQYRLSRLGRADGDSMEMCAFYPEALALGYRWLFTLLAVLPLAFIALIFFNTTWGIIGLVANLILNFNLSSIVKNRSEGGFRSARFFASALGCARHLAPLLKTAAPDQADGLRRAAAGFRGSMLSIQLLNFNDLMEGSLGFDLSGFFLFPLLAYGSLVAKLKNSGETTLELYRTLGDVDLAIAVLSTQVSLPYFCRPAFTGETRLACRDLYHPLLTDPVPNSAVFTGGMLVTGSNASGKSTFIKAVALNCLFAQTVGFCTANGFTLRSGMVATSMAVEDSVVDGDSYFVAEIKSMRRLMQQAGGERFCWFFVDEILKGTNTVERVAASAAVLRQLAAENCLTFAATHDVELTAILGGLYGNCHFRETVRPAKTANINPDETENTADTAAGSVFFDYKLHDGPATTRNAILLLERMDFPKTVTTGARALVERFEATGEWETPAK